MTQVATTVELVQDEENRLWTAYLIAEARHDEAGRFYHEAWRNYVLTDMDDRVKEEVWHQAADMWRNTREQANEAHLAWKRVAYPQHNIPYDEDKESS